MIRIIKIAPNKCQDRLCNLKYYPSINIKHNPWGDHVPEDVVARLEMDLKKPEGKYIVYMHHDLHDIIHNTLMMGIRMGVAFKTLNPEDPRLEVKNILKFVADVTSQIALEFVYPVKKEELN